MILKSFVTSEPRLAVLTNQDAPSGRDVDAGGHAREGYMGDLCACDRMIEVRFRAHERPGCAPSQTRSNSQIQMRSDGLE